jgi:hypothetical protein
MVVRKNVEGVGERSFRPKLTSPCWCLCFHTLPEINAHLSRLVQGVQIFYIFATQSYLWLGGIADLSRVCLAHFATRCVYPPKTDVGLLEPKMQ